MADWTIQKLLNWITRYLTEKDIDSPRLSAEMLLSEVLSLERIELYTCFDTVVEKEKLGKLHQLVKRAGEKEPVAYLIGRCEFYSLEISLDNNCLIPRPETELLVERAVEFLRTRSGRQSVCELCTGSGCVATAIAKNFPSADIIATDISQAALSVAKKNVENHGLGARVRLLAGDLFEPVKVETPARKFDLVVCNGPYVSESEYEALDENIKNHEPASALLAGVDGLDVYRKVIAQAGDFLKNKAAIMLEIGSTQAGEIKTLFEQTGDFGDIRIVKDFQNLDRLVIAGRCRSQ